LYKLFVKNDEIEVLSLTKLPNKPARALIPPKHQQQFENDLISNEMKFKIINSDVSNLILIEKFENEFKRSGQKNILENFLKHGEINDYLDELANKYSNRVTVTNEGKSYEGRSVKSITITNGDSTNNNEKKR